jgi:hypothetical protein
MLIGPKRGGKSTIVDLIGSRSTDVENEAYGVMLFERVQLARRDLVVLLQGPIRLVGTSIGRVPPIANLIVVNVDQIGPLTQWLAGRTRYTGFDASFPTVFGGNG